MSPRAKIPASTKPTKKHNGRNKDAANPSPPPPQYRLTPEREAELTVEANSLGDNLLRFPGNHARRVAWSSRIQLAAERDAADLVRTPFPDDEPPLTLEEIHGMRDKIEFQRVTQSRWRAIGLTQLAATAAFKKGADEAGGHKEALLSFFDLRFRNSPEGQRRVSDIRTGSGDADLVQDISDVLVLCNENKESIAKAPRDEAKRAARLAELSPMLSRLLADKTLSPEALQARKLRDGAYTLVNNAERRMRAAAEYWYGSTDRMKDYAFFPASAQTSGDDEEDATAEPPAPAPEAAPVPPPA